MTLDPLSNAIRRSESQNLPPVPRESIDLTEICQLDPKTEHHPLCGWQDSEREGCSECDGAGGVEGLWKRLPKEKLIAAIAPRTPADRRSANNRLIYVLSRQIDEGDESKLAFAVLGRIIRDLAISVPKARNGHTLDGDQVEKVRAIRDARECMADGRLEIFAEACGLNPEFVRWGILAAGALRPDENDLPDVAGFPSEEWSLRADKFYSDCRAEYDAALKPNGDGWPISREEIAEQERDCRRLASMSWADGEFYYCELMLARADAARDALGLWRNVA